MNKKFSVSAYIFVLTLLLLGCGKKEEEIIASIVEEPVIIVGKAPDAERYDNNDQPELKDDADVNEFNEDAAGDEDIVSDEAGDENIIEENDEEEADDASERLYEEVETETVSEQNDWVAKLNAASQTDQLLIVSAKGSTCKVSFHEKNNQGIWEEIFATDGKLGKNGVGKTKEGDGKTPKGTYHFTMCFGRKENPGCKLNYVRVNDSHYWVDDVNSAYYNRFVSTDDTVKDWNSAEHLNGAGESYNYALATDYNSACVKGAGSAIFVHCLPTGGAGCVAIPEDKIKILVSHVKQGCNIIIDSADAIETY